MKMHDQYRFNSKATLDFNLDVGTESSCNLLKQSISCACQRISTDVLKAICNFCKQVLLAWQTLLFCSVVD